MNATYMPISWIGGVIGAVVLVVLFFIQAKKNRANNLPLEVEVDYKHSA